jgi:uncharacterized RDD family membrane protein YckC
MSAVGKAAGPAAPGTLAERGARLAAVTIDDLIVLAICLPAIFGAVPRLSAMMADVANGGDLDPYALIWPMITGVGAVISTIGFIAWAVVTTWLVATNGQTIGKRALGIKVVRKDGSRASLGRIFWLRNIVNMVPGFLPYIGLLYELLLDPVMIYQDSRQCLHDRIADTIVIKA